MSRGAKIVDLTGKRFGKLIILGLSHKKPKSTKGTVLFWKYQCDCGNVGAASGGNLKTGQTTSCGCVYRASIGNLTRTHGMRHHSAYSIWCAMKARCSRSTHVGYENYGGRGISVCDRWQSFEAFWEDMGATWFDGATIERKDVNGNYEPSNCIWLEAARQAANTRKNVFMETPWGMMTVADAARRSGIPYEVIRMRFHAGKRGDELFAPAKRKKRCIS